MAGNATFVSVCAGESQGGNPIGSALVIQNSCYHLIIIQEVLLLLPCVGYNFCRQSIGQCRNGDDEHKDVKVDQIRTERNLTKITPAKIKGCVVHWPNLILTKTILGDQVCHSAGYRLAHKAIPIIICVSHYPD